MQTENTLLSGLKLANRVVWGEWRTCILSSATRHGEIERHRPRLSILTCECSAMLILERILFRNESYSGIISNMKEDHRSLYTQLLQLRKESLKKFRLVRVSNLDLCDTGAALYQFS